MSKNSALKFLTYRVKILKIISEHDEGIYNSQIARLLNTSKQRIQYYIKQLEKADHIERRGKKPIFYTITQNGQNFLERYEKRRETGDKYSSIVRLHIVVLKFPILKEPEIPVVWSKVTKMKNWNMYTGSYFGLTVRKTPKHLLIFAKSVEGRDPYQMMCQASIECHKVAQYLESKFRMKLGYPKLARKPHFGIYDQTADRVTKNFELTSDVGKMDRSKGGGEIDTFDPKTAKNYLLMPNMVACIMRDMEDVKTSMITFEEGMKMHMILIEHLRTIVIMMQKALTPLLKVYSFFGRIMKFFRIN